MLVRLGNQQLVGLDVKKLIRRYSPIDCLTRPVAVLIMPKFVRCGLDFGTCPLTDECCCSPKHNMHNPLTFIFSGCLPPCASECLPMTHWTPEYCTFSPPSLQDVREMHNG